MKIKYPRILFLARGDMINITALQDPLYPLSKLTCHLLQTCLPGLHGLSGSYPNASAQALSPNTYCSFLPSAPPTQTHSSSAADDMCGLRKGQLCQNLERLYTESTCVDMCGLRKW